MNLIPIVHINFITVLEYLQLGQYYINFSI